MNNSDSVFFGLLLTISSTYYFKVVSRILFAVVIGGLVGLERESKNRPAGFRTHILVCVAACSLMVLSEIMFINYYSTYGIVIDPQRIGAQVISGIGFLGAGTIMHFGKSVRGLTTAASIWAVAALGLISGAGLFFLAFFTFVVIEIVLFFFTNYSDFLSFGSKTQELFITVAHSPKIVGEITMFFADRGIQICEITFPTFKEKKLDGFEYSVSKLKVVINLHNSPFLIEDIVKELESLSGILSVEI